ncbi:Probable leucine-rich repeat receptor-like protein kinase At2g33170 [Durusdinium trenchii]|uniref:Probable leucine-rich repeat receptor-like protein kinase At2g33170 n=1 Tax=Durusdinium trenchii TaxID=1381693 RepID=A0ABP0JKN4_9DINO
MLHSLWLVLASCLLVAYCAKRRDDNETLFLSLLELGVKEDDAARMAQEPCQSKGFFCDEEEIVGLVMTGWKLGGRIPKGLRHLSRLEGIFLERNHLQGGIPAELSELMFLRFLILSENQLSGAIPTELQALKNLRKLDLFKNQLTGPIPPELGTLSELQVCMLSENQLTGTIPKEFCQLHGLHTLDLSQNPLSGEIPKELGKLEAMERLYISGTHISGPIPRELSQMHSLIYLFLPDNDLEGPMPGELGRLQLLQELHLSQNRLSGAIPKELGQMETLQKLELSANQLEGEIPKELGQLKSLRMLSLAQNRLQGRIPQELEQLRFLQELILSKNELQGSSEEIASILQSMRLEVLDLGHNSFAGELNEWRAEVVQELQLLDLSHNKFFGNLSRFVEIFCSLSPPGGSLLELRLNHNRFTGEMPPCLMQFSNLNFLALNNNRLRGSLPPIHASELVVLALHKNKLSGVLPESLHHLKRLGVLTLHENSIGGPISGLNLSTACMDNSKFRIEGMGCGLKLHHIDPHDPVHQLKQIYANCPTLMGCDRAGTANLTLHRNRFSCAVPKSLGSSKISGLVIMGNMLGSGRELNFSWIRPEEKQSFLYYSKEVWTSNQVVIAGFVLLFFFGALCYQPRQRLEASSPHLNFGTGARVASANLGVLKSARITTLLALPLLLLFWASGNYYECSPLLWQSTAANSSVEPLAGLGVISCWCTMLFLFRTLFASMPMRQKERQRRSTRHGCVWRIRRLLAWGCWVCIVTALSLPSILFSCAQSLPGNGHRDTSGSDFMFKLVYHATPLLIVVIDVVLAAKLSTKYCDFSGIKADRLLMTFRLFAAWLLPLLITVVLDENCLSVWKMTWSVCQPGSPEHKYFDWNIYEEEILDTDRDICTLSQSWWSDGRCSRAIVGNLTSLLLQKLLVRSTLYPLALWLTWQGSRLEEAGTECHSGRHLKLFGFNTTNALAPLQQMSFLTTQFELLAFWTPLVPLLSFGVLGVASANLLILDLALWSFRIQLPSNEVNQLAALSRSYLSFAHSAGCCFQLWHAFGSQMYGRYILLIFSIAVMNPWATRFLPLKAARRYFWAEVEKASQTEFIEMAVQMDEPAGSVHF